MGQQEKVTTAASSALTSFLLMTTATVAGGMIVWALTDRRQKQQALADAENRALDLPPSEL